MGDGRIWHYIDGTGAQVGPVDAAALKAALAAGTLTLEHVAWREGMANWRPLRELAGEVGIAASADAPAMPPPPPLAGGANPYDPMPHAGLVFRERDADIVYAGFLRRWAALWLDQMIMAVPLVLMLFALGALGAAVKGEEPSPTMGLVLGLVYLLWFAANALYYALQESSAAQATLGKRALGIKVTDAEGRRIGFGQALGRWFAAALSYLSFYIGFLLAAGTRRKQALHDFVAGTLVVDRWAYTDHPERQKRGLSGCLVVFLIAMLAVPIIAIVAAMAISQYQDYVVRSQVAEGSALADGVKTAIGEYVNNRGEFPASNEDAGLPAAASIAGAYVSSVDIGRQPGRIDVLYSAAPPQRANAAIEGHTLSFIGQIGPGSITWTCASEDLKQKWCPSSCQCDGH